ncbi:hypothetical protein PAXINDRAFT_14770 [Paxillus involutus ATCC 200175]|uniref:Uncharacterized protein n=1 Tax=Paxillus involutus ATCC 200175 TaxID=664439 RepID=A0A0C9TYR8_PAXIN|nr:hypothetical protein PAXINDRAFT_14770 [Paxillus involutus ATCC 200175]
MAKSHGYKGAFIMAGSMVNQDGGLGFAFTTPEAENFFAERCRADINEIIGHFKAHIYNKSSLAAVAQAFDGDDERSSHKREVDEDNEGPETIDPEEREDHARVWSELVQALVKVGCKWASGKLFPWKYLPAKLAKSGVRGINYPAEVSFPGEERNPRPKGGSKGISDLTLAECSMLVVALRDTSKGGLRFKLMVDMKAELMASQVPVIEGAAPEHDSPHPCVKRMFCNLKTDRQGLLRKSNPTATHIKKRTARTLLSSTSLQKCISKRPEVVITHSAKLLKKVTTTFADDDLSSLSGSEYQPEEDTSKAGEGLDHGLTLESGDASEYEQDHDSRKCKRKLDISLHTSKKCAVSQESVSTEAPPSRGKGKAKSQSTDTKRVGRRHPRVPSSLLAPSSEDEVDFNSASSGLPQANPLQTVNPTPQDIHKPHATEPSRKSTPQGHAPDMTVPSLGHPHAEASDGVAPAVEEQDSDTCHISAAPPPSGPIPIPGRTSTPIRRANERHATRHRGLATPHPPVPHAQGSERKQRGVGRGTRDEVDESDDKPQQRPDPPHLSPHLGPNGPDTPQTYPNNPDNTTTPSTRERPPQTRHAPLTRPTWYHNENENSDGDDNTSTTTTTITDNDNNDNSDNDNDNNDNNEGTSPHTPHLRLSYPPYPLNGPTPPPMNDPRAVPPTRIPPTLYEPPPPPPLPPHSRPLHRITHALVTPPVA